MGTGAGGAKGERHDADDSPTVVAGSESGIMQYALSEGVPKWQAWPLIALMQIYSLIYILWALPIWIIIGVIFDPFKWMARPLARIATFLTVVGGPVVLLGYFLGWF